MNANGYIGDRDNRSSFNGDDVSIEFFSDGSIIYTKSINAVAIIFTNLMIVLYVRNNYNKKKNNIKIGRDKLTSGGNMLLSRFAQSPSI